MKERKFLSVFVCLLMVATVFAVGVPVNVIATDPSDVEFEWVKQFGSSGFDNAASICLLDDIFITGTTWGTLPGQTSQGSADGYVRRMDTDGNEIWTRQFGTSAMDYAVPMDMDSTGMYVSGFTYGAFPGYSALGYGDIFLVKYDINGNQLWVRQFGTSGADWATTVCVSSSGVYVGGVVEGALPGCDSQGYYDSFLRKYSTDGDEIWTVQFGSSNWDQISTIVVTEANIYAVGFIGILPNFESDGFVMKFNIDGEEIWFKTFSTPEFDMFVGASVFQEDIYVSGYTEGTLPGQVNEGGTDSILLRYDADGNIVWGRQFGTSGTDYGYGICTDVSGIYMTGTTNGILSGQTNFGGVDGYVCMYGFGGSKIWTYQFGTDNLDNPNLILVDDIYLYLGGYTSGTFPGQTSSGAMDAFVAKLGITNPESLLLALIDAVSNLNLHQGIENSLDAKLNVVLKALSDLKENNDGAAINALEAFINEIEAQAGNKISEDEANVLIQAAQKIINLLINGGN